MGRPVAGIEAYKQERLLWQAVIQTNEPIVVRCKSRPEALQMLQRLHIYRALDRKNTFEGTYSILDDYIIKNPDKGTTIVIEKRYNINELQIETASGERVDLQIVQQIINEQDRYKSDQFFRASGLDKLENGDFDPDAPPDLETA